MEAGQNAIKFLLEILP